MWETVVTIAAVVVIILFLQLLDGSESLKERLSGGSPRKEFEERVTTLEGRLDEIESKINSR